MGKVTIVYYLSTTIIAVLIGLVAVSVIHPWKNTDSQVVMKSAQVEASMSNMGSRKLIDPNSDSVVKVFHSLLNRALVNPFKALSEGNILGIVMAALLFGMAFLFIQDTGAALAQIVKEINHVMNKALGWIIMTTPVGVFAIVFDFKLKVTGDIFSQLLSFCLLVFGATMVHGLLVLPAIAWVFGGVGPKEFFSRSMKPILLALSTASSSATLPVTMKTCEEEFGVSKGVSGFVFPLGATMNMDGTALFEGIAAVFLAHLYGIELSQVAMFSIFFMAMLSSIGAPGMPSGSMSGMQMVMLAAGIPLEAIGVLLVVERPLDTFRTAVNVEGDMIGAIVTEKFLAKSQATS
jgi:Na+/H+-dicarboxylate symporter